MTPMDPVHKARDVEKPQIDFEWVYINHSRSFTCLFYANY